MTAKSFNVTADVQTCVFPGGHDVFVLHEAMSKRKHVANVLGDSGG